MAKAKLPQSNVDQYERLDGAADIRLLEDAKEALEPLARRARTPIAKTAFFLARRALHGAESALRFRYSSRPGDRYFSECVEKFLNQSQEAFYTFDSSHGKARLIRRAIGTLDQARYDLECENSVTDVVAGIINDNATPTNDGIQICASVAAWTKAINEWQGKIENPKGGSRVGAKPYFWYEVVYMLLNEHEIGDIHEDARQFVRVD